MVCTNCLQSFGQTFLFYSFQEMPLLHKKPFVHETPPPDLKPEDTVFFCKVTGEVFTDYE